MNANKIGVEILFQLWTQVLFWIWTQVLFRIWTKVLFRVLTQVLFRVLTQIKSECDQFEADDARPASGFADWLVPFPSAFRYYQYFNMCGKYSEYIYLQWKMDFIDGRRQTRMGRLTQGKKWTGEDSDLEALPGGLRVRFHLDITSHRQTWTVDTGMDVVSQDPTYLCHCGNATWTWPLQIRGVLLFNQLQRQAAWGWHTDRRTLYYCITDRHRQSHRLQERKTLT